MSQTINMQLPPINEHTLKMWGHAVPRTPRMFIWYLARQHLSVIRATLGVPCDHYGQPGTSHPQGGPQDAAAKYFNSATQLQSCMAVPKHHVQKAKSTCKRLGRVLLANFGRSAKFGPFELEH